MNSDNTQRINPERVRNSASYRGALAKAAKILKKPEKLKRLISDASRKASKLNKGALADIKDQLMALFRLVKAYANGDYRGASWSNLILIVSSLVYFVTPLDLVPDFIVALGYFDDAALLGWTIRTIGDELSEFLAWEERIPSKESANNIEIATD